jgi:hypothetical protein
MVGKRLVYKKINILMDIKLIQAGGFIGRQKTACKHVADVSSQLAEEVKQLVPIDQNQQSKARDLEKHYLQFNDDEPILIKVDQLKGELKSHIDELMKHLSY